MEKYKHEMTAGTLKVWAQDDTGGPRAINNSSAVNCWLLKECNLGICAKPALGLTKLKHIQHM